MMIDPTLFVFTHDLKSNTVHVRPASEAHVLVGNTCWCEPDEEEVGITGSRIIVHKKQTWH